MLHTGFQLVPKSTTWDDLKVGPWLVRPTTVHTKSVLLISDPNLDDWTVPETFRFWCKNFRGKGPKH